MAGFFFGDVADAVFFDFLGGGNEDGGVALTGHPKTFVRFGVKRNEGGEVGFHRLIFLEWERQDKEEESKR